ncbi:MAG: RNA 2',3'-cyclic phosphodiesterase [Anaerolineae bacterium]|nr:RNA 2',3'-cyclic phosphodiesterase [Anaerolineae bacterium]
MRLFVAIDLPGTVKDQLGKLQTPIPTARWVSREQMHLTLFFIGETEKNRAVQEALAQVQAAPFEMALEGVGRFPGGSRKPPRVLWVGVKAPAALGQLHTAVTAALVDMGFNAESRPFSPHITLARLKTERPLREVDAFLQAQADFRTAPFRVDRFVLFASTLTPQGARYSQQAVVELKANPT